MPTKIKVAIGEQKFSPVQYQSFSCGPIEIEIELQNGESVAQAYERAYAYLLPLARTHYTKAREQFYNRLEGREK